MSRELAYWEGLAERLRRERDEARYAAGAWEVVAELRMTPAEHAESKTWIEINARECARKRVA